MVTANNDDLRLLPYLTANVRFEVDKRDDVLLVPNAALRYTPRPELVEQSDEEGDASTKDDGPGNEI